VRKRRPEDGAAEFNVKKFEEKKNNVYMRSPRGPAARGWTRELKFARFPAAL